MACCRKVAREERGGGETGPACRAMGTLALAAPGAGATAGVGWNGCTSPSAAVGRISRGVTLPGRRSDVRRATGGRSAEDGDAPVAINGPVGERPGESDAEEDADESCDEVTVAEGRKERGEETAAEGGVTCARRECELGWAEAWWLVSGASAPSSGSGCNRT